MTEAGWWSATKTNPALDWLFFDELAADRKLRLFAVACCARAEHLLTNKPVWSRLLAVVERYVDGMASEEDVEAACQEGWNLARGSVATTISGPAGAACLDAAADIGGDEREWFRDRAFYQDEDDQPYCVWVTNRVLQAVVPREHPDRATEVETESKHHVNLLHDIFGPLPFRDVAIGPGWLTPDVVALATGIYDRKAFDRLPILADALEDAGCTNPDVLAHCRRADWEHVRGCWVVDLLLGKPWREVAS